jgi:2-polyprenyl-6-methoxyphenol hydroxylase-like FAD-dependent oxidoreductase
MDYEIIIIGAGPVGLTLALDLGQRGVRTLVLEKNEAPLGLPKMERSNPRTMEIWRRLGVADEIRAVGLAPQMAMDIMVLRDLVREPLIHQQYPSVAETRRRIEAANDGSTTREPYQLVSQYVVEPILMNRVRELPSVTVRQGVEYLGHVQDANGVSVETRGADGKTETLRCNYLVGCDGGGSSVRKHLGIKLKGKAGLGTVYNIFFRSDDLLEKSKVGFARHYCFANQGAGGGAGGTIVVQGDQKHFALHIFTEPPEDPAALIRSVTGLDIQPEVLFCQPWTQHMMVAERHMDRRVFLAGDANHLYIPAGGLGMNTGIGDTVNLGWKLEAAVRGWGGPALLESYGVERNDTALRNLAAVDWAVAGVLQWRGSFDPLVFEDSPAGAESLSAFKKNAEPLNRRVYEMHGADLGYRFVSDVIDDSEGPAPQQDCNTAEPSGWPGAHLPHFWLEPGQALYDRLSTRAYTLIKLGKDAADTLALEQAFGKLGAPLDVLEIDHPEALRVLEKRLVLVRPDLHIVWRGAKLPAACDALAAKVTGQG